MLFCPGNLIGSQTQAASILASSARPFLSPNFSSPRQYHYPKEEPHGFEDLRGRLAVFRDRATTQ